MNRFSFSAVRNVLFQLLGVAVCAATVVQADPVPLTHVHAHNDCEHTHPLFDALDHGFCSVEADIHLVNGQLLVAHTRFATKAGRTLQSLYLDPLRARAKQNGGHVYPGGPEVVLLIDIKGDWHTTYPVLRKVLEEYSDIISTFKGETKQQRAILAVVTGDRALNMFEGEAIRYAAYDGSLAELNSTAPAALIPWISHSWASSFKWRGKGEIPTEERARVKEIVAKAHEYGRRVRFWGSPDQREFWREMLADGVDLINTDDLAGAERFFQENGAGKH